MTDSSMALALAGISFMLTVIWGTPLIRILRYFKLGETIRVDGPQRHFSKLGTPTMGGVMIILPVVLVTVILNAATLIGETNLLGRSVILPLGVLVSYALLGSVDDWEGLRGRRAGEGMRGRTKLIFQIIIAFLAAIGLKYVLDVPDMYLPGFNFEIELGIFYVPIATFLIVAESNAVNLTDGLDGLAGLISATAFAAYGSIALMQGQVFVARFCFTVTGAVFAFLWFNVHPAQLFMGDTGSLPMGATLAVVALMTGQWPLLVVIAVIPLSETLSVVIQVAYFKISGGRRILKMAPLHHHFELSGWSETQIVQRFWLISLIGGMVGTALALV